MTRAIAALALVAAMGGGVAPVAPCQTTTGSAVFAGAEAGSLLPVAVEGTYLRYGPDGRRRWAVDIRLEPSDYWQSYSIASAWHVRGWPLFVGGRLRQVLLHSPWSRGYDPAVDRNVGLSAEAGFRWVPGFAKRRLLITTSVGATHVSGSSIALPMLYNINAGLGWRIRGR